MALTLATLKSSMDMYLENDSWGTTDQQNTIIQQAEERINQTIQVANYNTKVETGSLAIGDEGASDIADSDTAPIGALYFKIRPSGGTADDNVYSFLLLKDYNFLQEYAPVDSANGVPAYYSFYNDASDSNAATFPIAPRANVAYTYEILYWFEPTSLVTDTGGTWLSTHGESALLYGCLVEAYTFLKGEADLTQVYHGRYQEALQGLVLSQRGAFRNSTYRERASVGAV